VSNYTLLMLREVGLSENFARAALAHIKISSLEPNEVIWQKGGNVTSWQLIIQGIVVAAAPISETEKLPITVYGHHAWFGEQPILNRQPTPLEYMSVTPVQLLKVPDVLVLKAFEQEVQFSKFMAKLIAWRAQTTAETLVLMKFGSPALRVVLGLAMFSEALAARSTRPPTDGIDGGLEIPIKQNMLASLCGVSRTLFSEFVHELQANGWLNIHYGKIELLSTGTWQRFVRRLRQRSLAMTDASIQSLLFELDHAAVV